MVTPMARTMEGTSTLAGGTTTAETIGEAIKEEEEETTFGEVKVAVSGEAEVGDGGGPRDTISRTIPLLPLSRC